MDYYVYTERFRVYEIRSLHCEFESPKAICTDLDDPNIFTDDALATLGRQIIPV